MAGRTKADTAMLRTWAKRGPDWWPFEGGSLLVRAADELDELRRRVAELERAEWTGSDLPPPSASRDESHDQQRADEE